MPERIGNQPPLDICPVAGLEGRRQDRAELHKVTQQYGALRCLGHGEQNLRQRSGTYLIDEHDVIRTFQDRLDRTEAGEGSRHESGRTDDLTLRVPGQLLVLVLEFGVAFLDPAASGIVPGDLGARKTMT